MKNRNIVIVSCVFPPEPVVSANLSSDLATMLSVNHNVTVLSPNPTRPFGKVFKQDKINPISFKHIIIDSFVCPQSKLLGRLKESWSYGIKTAAYIRANHATIDVIYANTWPMFAQYFLARTAKKYKIPLVIHVQDIYPDSLVKKLPKVIGSSIYQLLLPIDKYILGNSSKIIGISQNMVSYLSKSRNVSHSKFELVRNWQNDDIFNIINRERATSSFTYMYLGSISPSAGLDVIIKAFDKASLPNAILRIIGNGSKKQDCQRLAQELKCKNIMFEEAYPEEVPMIQSQADILLLPLLKGIAKTASPSKMTAYFLSGKPIIACVENDSDTASCIQEAKCGFIIEPESTEKLADCFKVVYALPLEERNKMGERARKFANQHLSKTANLNKLTKIIEEQE